MFEINVSLNGKHLFATHERSIRHSYELERVLPEIQKRFPTEEGFNINVSYEPQISYAVSGSHGSPQEIIEKLINKTKQ